MTTSSTDAQAPVPKSSPLVLASKTLQPYLAPYYLTIAGVLAGVTVIFGVVIVLLILVVANFNVLGLFE